MTLGTPRRLKLAALATLAALAALALAVAVLLTRRPLAVLEPEWGRCVEVRGERTPLCIFDPNRPLHLWLDHEGADQAEISIDGEAVDSEHYPVTELSGIGFRISLPTTARQLEVTVPDAEPWTLALRSKEAPDELADELAAADAKKQSADEAFVAGETVAANAIVDEALARALNAGLTSMALDVTLMASFRLQESARQPERARDLLDRMRSTAQSFPRGRALWESRSALLLWAKGDLTGAAAGFREASQFAIRTDDGDLVAEAMPMYAAILANLGYFSAARHWSRFALERLDPSTSYYGQVIETAGWVNLVLRRDGHSHDDPVALYEQAVKMFGPGGPHHAFDKLGLALLGLAEAHFLDGRPQAAREQLQRLARLAEGTLTFDYETQRDDLELRIALELGAAPQVLEDGLAKLRRSAEQTGTPEARWWLAVRRGDVLARAGRWAGAAEAYREGKGWLDEIAREVAFGVGRSAVGANRREGTLRLAEALLKLGKPGEALCALREAEGRRAQTPLPSQLDAEQRALAEAYVRKKGEFDAALLGINVSTLEERRKVRGRLARELDDLRDQINELLLRSGRQVGRPSCSDLSPREDGELLLAIYPTGDEWLVFAQDEQTTSYRVLAAEMPRDAGDRDALATTLLEPIAERLGRALRLRVLATGHARQVDVQVLPWRGRPLLQAITVTHGAELVPRALRDWPETPRALLIADPTQSLPLAEREITEVDANLSAGGFSTEIMAPDQALADTVGRALEQADLLHFSGHSEYPGTDEHGLWPPYAGGTPGRASSLVLAAGQSLAIQDIVLLESVPRVVVLEGCEAGALDPAIGGMSLALAFVAKGSRAVIASPERLRNEHAAALGTRLYADLPGDGRVDVAEALRRAQTELWDTYPDPEQHLGRYRVWVP